MPGRLGSIANFLLLAWVVYTLATIQLVWAYHSRVPPYLHLDRYENGLEVTPCQTRVLMMWLLRWAHHNAFLIRLADLLSRFTPIYRSHITPETFVFAITDTAGVVLAGWVATRIYDAASERRLLTAYIYPLVLVLCAVTYVVVSLHPRSFYYDLPSLGFFAVGLYLIYFRKHPLWFAAFFIVATLNRETTLLLLLFFVLAAMTESGKVEWRRGYLPRTLAVVVPLGDLLDRLAHVCQSTLLAQPLRRGFRPTKSTWCCWHGRPHGRSYLLPAAIPFFRSFSIASESQTRPFGFGYGPCRRGSA